MALADVVPSFSEFPYYSVLLALFFAFHGLRKRSLSPSGAVGAALVASIMMAVQLRIFGVSLLVFYLIGSRATKVGKKLKGQLEADHAAEGYRNIWQVISNAFSAFIASILWSALFVENSLWSKLLPESVVSHASPFNIDQQCPVSLSNPYSRFLIFSALGHCACCLGDTLASELGILSPTRPILVTTLRAVPPGTNGAMSLVGTTVSFLGGGIIGLSIAITLLVQSSACREDVLGLASGLISWGLLAGGIGSLLDSLMGATIQRTRYSKKNKKILQDDSITTAEDEVTIISGLNILTNGQINLLSSILTSLLIGYLASG
ncbi:hypothetical protein M422DRAFT_231645 [Sphaerobolus stellatus SS14]|uniref:Transmembrane protein 19 n=1 Tax=Sphaerobolus stellatus (strain SS14) TaxID=990650 RepID=A0A0C9URX8_SPHS4|nr:hypothetical protein M422DRAFT_231645 [Sphaerobolus stellatus SS14]